MADLNKALTLWKRLAGCGSAHASAEWPRRPGNRGCRGAWTQGCWHRSGGERPWVHRRQASLTTDEILDGALPVVAANVQLTLVLCQHHAISPDNVIAGA